MRNLKHLDEARDAAKKDMLIVVARESGIHKAVIVDDLIGRVTIAVWTRTGADAVALRETIDTSMRTSCAQYWTGDVWFAEGASAEDATLYDYLWTEGVRINDEDKLRINDRHRNRLAWFRAVDTTNAPWIGSPPLVVFHSVKGGMGRTTALAAYAMSRARRGETVAVVDFDLDAPGIGRLLDADGEGTTANWGVIDFLLEARHDLPLDDYMHRCQREAVTGSGVIEVFPAGRLDDSFLTKLSRVDLEATKSVQNHPLFQLLQRIKEERKPSIILLDCRAGLSPAAGLLLSGVAHMHVLFGNTNPQSIDGLTRVVRHLGYEQALQKQPQAECLIVHAMVPDNAITGKEARDSFAASVEEIFRFGYYAEKGDTENTVWSLEDLSTSSAPHVPVPLPYRGELAFFDSIDQIADALMREYAYASNSGKSDETEAKRSFCDRLDEKLSSVSKLEVTDA